MLNTLIINEINHKKNRISFAAGLTSKIMQEIQCTNVVDTSNRLAKKGIPTDFKNNKVIAWCSEKVVDIIQQLNKQYGTKLALPKGIFVEDFTELAIDDSTITGFCNLLPAKFKKNSVEIISAQTIFFNSYKSLLSNASQGIKDLYEWKNLNSIANWKYKTKVSSSPHFLYEFLHEFSHVSHEDRLLNKLGGKKLAKILEAFNETEQLQKYRDKYGQSVHQICNYAENTPLDAVACDMSRIIAGSLDKETLMPTKNPFCGTPYEKLYFWEKNSKNKDKDSKLWNTLRNFWNGKFY